MKTFEIMQKVERQSLAIERAKSVLWAVWDSLEKQSFDDEDAPNLIYVIDDLLLDTLSELKQVVEELQVKAKSEIELTEGKLETISYILFDKEKFFETIEALDPGDHDIRSHEIEAILKKNQGDSFELMYDGFRYGFLKGKEAEKAKDE